jgi:hypothetical protein
VRYYYFSIIYHTQITRLRPDGHRHHHPGNRLNDRLPNERRPEDRNRLNERPRPDPFAPGSPEPPRRPTDPRLPIETPKLPISNKVPIHKTNPAAPAPNKQQEEQALIDQLFKLEGRDEYPRSFDDEIYELLMRRFVSFTSVVVGNV